MRKDFSNMHFFHSINVPCLLLKANPPFYHIEDANDAYLRATNTSIDDIKGRALFDAFPDNPNDTINAGTKNLSESLNKVVKTRQTQKLVEQKYDIYIKDTDRFEVRYWNATNSPVIRSDGEVSLIIHSVEDVTSLVLLEESEKRNYKIIEYNKEVYKSLFDNNPDPAFAFDLEGNFFSANQSLANLAECEISDIIGKNFIPFVETGYRDVAYSFFLKARTGEVSTFNLKMFTAKGNVVTVSVTNTPIIVNNELIGVFGIAKDVTAQIENENLIKNSEQRFKSLVQDGGDLIAILDAQGNYKYVSPTSYSILGFHPTYYYDKNAFELIYAEDQGRVIGTFEKILSEKRVQVPPFRFYHADGSLRWIETNLTNLLDDPGINGIVANSRDVTEKIENQIKLTNALVEIEKIFNSSLDIICTIDKDGYFRKVSSASFQILGYKPEELINRQFVDFVHADDIESAKAIQKEIISGLLVGNYQNRFISREGRIIPMIWSAHWDEKDELMYCIARDDSERAKVENELRKERKSLQVSNERYEYLRKVTFDAVWDWDLKSDIIYWGDGFASLFGYDLDTIGNDITSWTSHIHPKDKQRVEDGIYQVINGEGNYWTDKYRYQKANGEYAIVLDRGFVIRKEDGTPRRMIGAMQDISLTESAELERKIALKIDELFYQQHELADILKQVSKVLLDYTGHYLCEIWMSDFDNSKLLLISQNSIDDSHIRNNDFNKVKLGEGFPGLCWLHKKDFYIENLESDNHFIRKEFAKNNGLITGKSVPLFYKNEVVAVINFFSKEKVSNLTFNLFSTYLNERLAANINRKQIENELNSFFQLSPDLLSVVSYDGFYKKVNASFQHKLGFDIDEIINTPVFKFIHEDDLKRANIAFQRLKNGKKLSNFECRIKKKDGSFNWLLWNAIPNVEENVIYIISVDITERKRNEEALEKAFDEKSQILESIGDAFFTMDKNFIVSYWNRVAEQITKIKRQEIIGKNLWDIFPEAVELPSYVQYNKALKTGQPVFFEDYYGIWLDVNAYPSERGLTVFFRDISLRKEAENILKKSLKEQEQILESIGDAFFAVDENFTVTYWNRKAEEYLFKRKDEILGKNLWDEFPTEARKSFYTNYHKVLSEKTDVHFEEYFDPLNKWFDVSAYPQKNGVSVYFRDITEKKKISEQFESVINNIPGVTYRCLVDSEWSIIFITQSVLDLAGYSVEEFLNEKQRSFSSIIHPDDMASTFDKLERIKNKEIFKIEYRIRTKNGTVKWVEDRGRGVFDQNNNLVFIDGVILDISERKISEHRLMELNTRLEKQREELLVNNAELEQFAYVASHDLQEPLRMITSFLTLLDKKYGSALDGKAKEYIHYAVDGAKNMRTVILDLLNYSRSTKDFIETEQIDLNNAVRETLKIFRNQIETKQAIVEVQKLPVLQLPKTQIQQVFQNLIANCLKYQSADRKLFIKIEASELESEWLFSVRDNGIGIKSEYLNQIFGIFQRLHTKDEYAGTGIGLAICKKIIQNLQGKIWAESEFGSGSVFYFTLPKN